MHQCTCAVELPSARCSGNAAAFPIGAISRFLRKKIPEAQASGSFSLSKKSLWAFSPSCFQNCKIKFCSMILQFCRCGGLFDAKGNPDGFLSHFSSLRNFQPGEKPRRVCARKRKENGNHFLRRRVRRRKYRSARKRAKGAPFVRCSEPQPLSNESPVKRVSFESLSKTLF